MAQQFIQINRGDTKYSVTKGTGAPTIAAAQVALTFDPTGMTTRDIMMALDKFKQYLFDSATWPPS